MRKISVDITIPFSFPREFEEKFGHFEIRRRHEIFSKVSEFTIDDLMFFSPPSFSDTGVKASVFEKMTLEKGFVPLDVFCAQAIYNDKEFLADIITWWFSSQYFAGNHDAKTILFLGSVVSRDGSDCSHYAFFEREYHEDNITFGAYEDDAAFVRDRDCILVFKPEFIEKLK